MNHTPGPWYEGSSGNHQGIIIHEATGATVAVSYDKKDTAIIAAAPELLDALELAEATIERVNPRVHGSCGGTIEVIRAAIRKAKGE